MLLGQSMSRAIRLSTNKLLFHQSVLIPYPLGTIDGQVRSYSFRFITIE